MDYMAEDPAREWIALASHMFPQSYEAEAMRHRAMTGRSSLDDFDCGVSYEDDDDDDDEDDDSETASIEEKQSKDGDQPAWYNSQAFQYNGRMQLVSLPGFILIFTIAGDLLVGVITLGSVAVYLLHVAGQKRRAFIAFVIAFILGQFTVLYTVFPLIWDSFFNLFFMMFVNMFVILTGVWTCLQFEVFYSKEFDVTRKLETFLYSGYPIINIIISTWVCASLTEVKLAPYFLLIFGFGILQIFLYPVRSSFVKSGVAREAGVYEMILDPGFVGLMGFIFALGPSVLYIIITVSKNYNSLFTFNTMTEFYFLASTSIFLSSLLDLRPFFQEADVSVGTVARVRWVCGVVALLLLSPTLTLHGLQLYFLPWLSVAVIINASFSYLISHRKTKMYGSIAALSLVGLYGFVFNKLPWQMTFYFASDLIHISAVNILLLITALLGMLCVYVSISGSHEAFSTVFLLQTIVLFFCEQILLSKDAYPLSLIVISAAVIIYTGFRLQDSGKLSKTCNWLMISVQLTKALVLSEHGVAARLPSTHIQFSPWWLTIYSHLSLLLFMLVISKALFFEDSVEISFNKWQLYVLGTGFSISFLTPTFLTDFYWIVMGASPNVPQIMALAFGVVSVVCLRLGMQYPTSWIGARYVGPTLLAMAITVAHLHPQLQWQWSELWKWLLLCSVPSWFLLLPLAASIRNTTVITLLALPLAAPTSLILLYMAFGEDFSQVTSLLYIILGTVLTALMLLVWRNVPSIYERSKALIPVIMLSLFGIAMAEGFTDHAVIATAAAALSIIAVCAKVVNTTIVNLDMDVQIVEQKATLALIGNICCVTAFTFFCIISPENYSQIMVIGSSGILLFLQRDGLLLRRLNKGSIYAPMFTTTAWVLWWSSYEACLLWSFRIPVHMLVGVVELIILVMAVPHYVALMPVAWLGIHIVPDKLLIFLLPLQFFLLIFGNSYWAWLLMLLSILTTAWTAVYPNQGQQMHVMPNSIPAENSS